MFLPTHHDPVPGLAGELAVLLAEADVAAAIKGAVDGVLLTLVFAALLSGGRGSGVGSGL